MDSASVTKVVVQVLTDIQTKQGLKCPPLDENVRPLKDLERFNSPMSIGATGKIGRKLGIKIPAGTNIFGDSKGLYTLKKTAALLCSLAATKKEEKAGA